MTDFQPERKKKLALAFFSFFSLDFAVPLQPSIRYYSSDAMFEILIVLLPVGRRPGLCKYEVPYRRWANE